MVEQKHDGETHKKDTIRLPARLALKPIKKRLFHAGLNAKMHFIFVQPMIFEIATTRSKFIVLSKSVRIPREFQSKTSGKCHSAAARASDNLP
ncbi:MAG TPA: hypothetical protein VFC85_08785 [Verrucomicrobiae bacterium]|nr:hypothetical protein [Verrucomicrobiae bacterium]